MTFSSRYRTHYEASFDREPVNETLRARIAQKTFQPHHPMSFVQNKYFLRTSFAALGVLISLPLVAPHAFAVGVQYAGEAISHVTEAARVTITRAFDPARDLFSDEAVTQLTEDPSMTNVEYTRNEQGEVIDIEKSCPGQEDCSLTLPGLDVEIEGEDDVQLHMEITGEGADSTVSIRKE